MDVSAVSSTTMATAAGQMQAAMETQMAMLRELAENQQEIAQMLVEGGLGQTIDVMA